jgi:hypothetical protein
MRNFALWSARAPLRAALGIGMCLLALLLPATARADSVILTTCDAADLITAITNANGDADADAIVLQAGCAGATSYTLTTVNNSDGGPNGLPVVTTNLTIEGNGSTILRSTANGTPAFRLLQVGGAGTLFLNNVTLQNGDAGGGNGGAVNIGGTLYMSGSTLSGNRAYQGGGMYLQSPGVLVMTTSSLVQNSATFLGGGVAMFTGGQLEITRSTFFQNTLDGGEVGAGLFLYNSTALVANSTFYDNDAGNADGGAIANEAGNLTVTNVTIASNTGAGPNNGGGILNQGNTLMTNTIVANNNPQDCSSINFMDQGNNLDSDNTCRFNRSSSLTNANAQLGTFGSYGGQTQTIPLGASSPAINAGNNFACNGQPVVHMDQRGVNRPQGTYCDMGAFELQLAAPGPACAANLPTPQPLSPAQDAVVHTRRLSLDWSLVSCATRYEVRVISDRNRRDMLLVDQNLTTSHYTTPKLKRHHVYTWQARACRNTQCSDWSAERRFTIEP